MGFGRIGMTGMFAWIVWSLTVIALGAGLYYNFTRRKGERWSQLIGGAAWAVAAWLVIAVVLVSIFNGGTDATQETTNAQGPVPLEVFSVGSLTDPVVTTMYFGVPTLVLLFLVGVALKKWEFESDARETRAAGIPTIRPFMRPWVVSSVVLGVGLLITWAGTLAFAFGLAYQADARAAFTTQSAMEGALIILMWVVFALAGTAAIATLISWPLQHFRILRAQKEYEQLCDGLGLEPGTPWRPAVPRRHTTELHVEGLR